MINRKNLYRFILLVILFFQFMVAKGQQDPMFTQYSNNIQSINPAYAGMWEKIGFFSMVRRQWAGIDKAPLTEIFSFHTPLRNEFVGLGLNVINDQIGREKRLSVFGDYSYKLLIKQDVYLRLGLKFGFLNYNNNLNEYKLYPDNRYDPAYQGDINLKFMPNFGVGGFLYSDDWYISLSVPKLIKNDFKANVNNYSSVAETRHVYITGGYIFHMPDNIKFKPAMLLKGTINAPVQLDISANFLIKDRFELGVMYRTGDAIGFIAQWIFNRKLRLGYAIDFSTSKIAGYQNGSHEFVVSYDVDFYGRSYVRTRYF